MKIKIKVKGQDVWLEPDEVIKDVPGIKGIIAMYNGRAYRIVGRDKKGPIWAPMKNT